MKKLFLALFISGLLLLGCNQVYAHGLDEVYEILGVSEPRTLPDSPIYFFKEWGRGIRLFFTFDAVKKAELELKFTDEKLAEAHKLNDEKPEAKDSLEKAFQNYLEAHDRLGKRLEALKGKNRNVDNLLDKLADRVIDHQKLFDDLEEKLEEEIKRASKEIAEEIEDALELNEKKFKAELKEKLEREGDDLEELNIFDDLFEFDEDLEEEFDDLFDEILGGLGKDAKRAAAALRESQEKIEDAEEALRMAEIARADLDIDPINLAEAKRLLSEAHKHWGFAKDEFDKENYKIVHVHVGHVNDFLKSFENALKKFSNLEKCGTPPGALGWICKDGKWVLDDQKIYCTQEYAPVCGADGKTYSNECHAKAAGITVKYRGECDSDIEADREAPPPPPPTAIERQEFKFEADDAGFYPSGGIAVAKGTKVKITFLVRSVGVYYGGLDFRSSKFSSVGAKPGGTASVEFTADDSFIITSYWPASGVVKSNMKVEVK